MKIITLEGIEYAEVSQQVRIACTVCDLNGEEQEGCGEEDIYGQVDTVDCRYLEPEERDLLRCGENRQVFYKRRKPKAQKEEFFRFTPNEKKLFTPIK